MTYEVWTAEVRKLLAPYGETITDTDARFFYNAGYSPFNAALRALDVDPTNY